MAATWRHGKDPPRPDAVGILALEVYFPSQYVRLSDMELADGCPGKYTVGLDQEAMAFCSDREDAVSQALSAAHSLMDKYGVRPEEIGHVQVATESSVDRSKSIKSHLMTLFTDTGRQRQRQRSGQPPQHPSHPGNGCAPESAPAGSASRSGGGGGGGRPVVPGPPAEGVDCVHACYGATAALMAAVAWVESRRWDGRFALVVAADVALYAPGTAARPTGGCGAAAILVGPDAPLVLDPLWHSSHSEHAWDFYKPLGKLPYPVVDGPETVVQYLGAAGWCALRLGERLRAAGELEPGEELLPRVNHYVAHSPFRKLARKGLARIALVDTLRAAEEAEEREAQARAAAAATAAAAGSSEPDGWVREWVAEEEREAQVPRTQPQAEARETRRAACGVDPTTEPHGTSRGGAQTDAGGRVDLAQAKSEEATHPACGCAASSASSSAVAAAVAAAATDGASAGCFAATDDAAGRSRQQQHALGPGPGEVASGKGPDGGGGSAAGAATGPGSLADLARSVRGGPAGPQLSYESYATCRLDDKSLEAKLMAATGGMWAEKAEDGSWLQKQVGNSYTASVWQGLASLVWRVGPALSGRRVMLFSFGSGTVASLLSLVGRGCGRGEGDGSGATASSSGRQVEGPGGVEVHPEGVSDGAGEGDRGSSGPRRERDVTPGGMRGPQSGLRGEGEGSPSDPRFTLAAMQSALDMGERMRARMRRPLTTFDAVAAQVEVSYGCPVPYEPRGDVSDVATGAYYLTRVDEQSRRWYERKA